MSSQPLEQRRKVFKQYKEDVKTRGKPFYPYAMLHDSVMSGVVVCVIIGLTVVWKWTTPGNHTGVAIVDGHPTTDGQGGWLGKMLDDPADSGTTSFVPRPDWYFYFLFYLLRIFKWPESVLLGTIGIPTICLILLLALPFVDRRAERRPLRRPVAMTAAILAVLSMGILTYKGAVAKEALGSEEVNNVPTWAAKEGFAGNKPALAGATLFAESGCLNCHTYNGDGGQYPGAPNLTAEGARAGRTVAFEISHLKCPSCVNSGSPMPSFARLGDTYLNELANFLAASKGDIAPSGP